MTGVSSKSRRPRAGPPGQCHTGERKEKETFTKLNTVLVSTSHINTLEARWKKFKMTHMPFL
jgi:hypothetical protein